MCNAIRGAVLAIGANRAVLVETNKELQAAGVAKLSKALVARERPGMIILGKLATNDDCNQIGQMLADLPQGDLRVEGRDRQQQSPRHR